MGKACDKTVEKLIEFQNKAWCYRSEFKADKLLNDLQNDIPEHSYKEICQWWDWVKRDGWNLAQKYGLEKAIKDAISALI